MKFLEGEDPMKKEKEPEKTYHHMMEHEFEESTDYKTVEEKWLKDKIELDTLQEELNKLQEKLEKEKEKLISYEFSKDKSQVILQNMEGEYEKLEKEVERKEKIRENLSDNFLDLTSKMKKIKEN